MGGGEYPFPDRRGGTPSFLIGGYTEYPPPTGTGWGTEQLRGGRYGSCVHAAGLTCYDNCFIGGIVCLSFEAHMHYLVRVP